jgi:hypothetical protein
VLLLTTTSRAMERTLHRTRPRAGRVARSTIEEILSFGSTAFRPLPDASLSPAIPHPSKRFDHLQTAPRLHPIALATSVLDIPSSRSRIILARKRSPTDAFVPRTKRPSSRTSSSVASSAMLDFLRRIHILREQFRAPRLNYTC